jgi:hypothetical protein
MTLFQLYESKMSDFHISDITDGAIDKNGIKDAVLLN